MSRREMPREELAALGPAERQAYRRMLGALLAGSASTPLRPAPEALPRPYGHQGTAVHLERRHGMPDVWDMPIGTHEQAHREPCDHTHADQKGGA